MARLNIAGTSGLSTGLSLIQTKLLRPRVGRDYLSRPHLIERLERGRDRKLTLISAPAGYGKSTLLSAWLELSPAPSAWLSLDEHDSDLRIFVAYLMAAIQSAFPDACPATVGLLNAPELPPVDYLATSLVNEIAGLPESFVLALDDYHLIAGQRVHQLVSALLRYQPRQLHLVIATRRDPPLPIVRLRAHQAMTEIRLEELRFVESEIRECLETCLNRDVSPDMVAVLARRTEGWIVGLRLACLALHKQEDVSAFLEAFQGTDRYIMEYLMDEVLSCQPRPIQDFLLRTSMLDRFCAPLCDVVIKEGTAAGAAGLATLSSTEILAQLEQANLFLLPLDQQSEWFRYHHLFRGLLRHRLHEALGEQDLAALHAAAGQWFDKNGYIEEALDHLLPAGDVTAAVALVARQRYALMNGAQWQQLAHLLQRFPPDVVDRIPDLLMLRTWLSYHQANWSELPVAIQRLDQLLLQAALPLEEIDRLEGEIGALRSLVAYLAADPQAAVAFAHRSIRSTPPDLWIVRALARLCLAGALQMTGNLQSAYDAIYQGYVEEKVESDAFKATLLATACTIYWIAADLQGLQQAADQTKALSQHANTTEMRGWAHHNLGCVAYHRNDLRIAEHHFSEVVQRPYLSYGDCYAYSACGLALTYQAQTRADEANAIADAALKFMLGSGNTSLLHVAEALQAELALRQGRVAAAQQWASRFKTTPPMVPVFRFFAPHLTLVKVWLAAEGPVGRTRATDLLARLKAFFEATHNTRFLIEVLALQALLRHAQGEQTAALADLDRAVTLAQPSGFIRLFVDLGPKQARLLADLRSADEERTRYVDLILAAFPSSSLGPSQSDGRQASLASVAAAPVPIVDPLTGRELDVMALLALGLSDKEIAERLVISSHTVRTHIKHILAKLEVRNRREAVVRAEQFGILSPG